MTATVTSAATETTLPIATATAIPVATATATATATAATHDNRRNWSAAFAAVRKLMKDGNDTAQVFIIMRALNGPIARANLARLARVPGGSAQIEQRVELARLWSDPAHLAQFAPGTVGAAYRAFLQRTGYSAEGLAEISELASDPAFDQPVGWMKRRTRDVHDVWHVLTGYEADEHLGEAALVAFSFPQTGGLGWAFIAIAAALKSMQLTRSTWFARAVFEGWRRGRATRWLLGEDHERLLQEPLIAARGRLGITPPTAYHAAQAALGPHASYVKPVRSDARGDATPI